MISPWQQCAQLQGVSVSSGLLGSLHPFWLTSLSLGLQAEMSWGKGQTEEVGSVEGGEVAVSQGTVLPARQPYLGFQEGQQSLGHPPGASMGKGALGRGCISSGRGLFWLDRYMACEQARIWTAGFRSTGPGGGPSSGLSTRGLCGQRPGCAEERPASSLLFCGDLSLTALSGRDDKQFT